MLLSSFRSSKLLSPKHILVGILIAIALFPQTNSKCYIMMPFICTPTEFFSSWASTVLSVFRSTSILDGGPANTGSHVDSSYKVKVPNVDRTKYYVWLAGAAYCTPGLPKWVCPWCIPGYVYIDGTVTKANVAAYVARNDALKEIVVGYRGSANVANIVQDLVFKPKVTRDPKIQLHAGFKFAIDSLYPFIRTTLTKVTAEYPNYKVIFTGHSLGAATAALAFYYIRREGLFSDTEFELYLYGLPRLGNKAFADYMNSQEVVIARVTSRGDVIPHVIPAGVRYKTSENEWESYYHHGQEIWIENAKDKVRVCSNDVYEDRKCSNSLGPAYMPLDHLFYYDVNIIKCMDTQPMYYLLQFFVPLNVSNAFMNEILSFDPGLRLLSGSAQLFQSLIGK